MNNNLKIFNNSLGIWENPVLEPIQNLNQDPPDLLVPNNYIKFVSTNDKYKIIFTWTEGIYVPMILNEKGEGPFIPLDQE